MLQLHIAKLPEDILFSIVEFLNPKCSQERVNILCELIVPVLPFLSKHFKNKSICDESDHVYFDKTYCIHTISPLDNDLNLHHKYFHDILKKLIDDLSHNNRLTVKNKRKRQIIQHATYTYHFPESIKFQKNHPFMKFIIEEILPRTQYKFSHMCCSGSGLFANA